LPFLLQQAIDLVFDEEFCNDDECDDDIESVVSSLLESVSKCHKATKIKAWCEQTVPRYSNNNFLS